MNSNSSKQILLSVIGVAILVVAVVGVSFAFFTYTKTGSTNNSITTGRLVFNFNDGDAINLENHFPIATADGLDLTGTNNVCTFDVVGSSTDGNAINYSVWMVPGATNGTKVRFQDSEVYVNIQAVTPTGAAFTPAMIATVGSAVSDLTADTVDTTRRLLGTGTVTASSNVTTAFTVRMWVDANEVTIGDSGSDTYTTEEYGNLYYSSKIVVTASAV